MLLALLLGVTGCTPPVSQPPSSNEDGGVPPTIVFLLDTHRAMQEYPTLLPEAFTPGHSSTMGAQQGDPGFDDPKYGHFINTGCSDPALVAAMSWFDKSSTDPGQNGSAVYDDDTNLGSAFFAPGRG